MILEKLSLINYKSFEEANFEFDAKINCIVGANGIGKTNVLDAIYHLAYGKSYFNPLSLQNINHNKEFFVIDGSFKNLEQENHVVCSLKRGQKKIIKRNGKIYDKFSEHLGLIPLVIISPMDQDLIQEGSDHRRKFIDLVISNTDKIYLHNLIQYQKVLSQRNALLKFFALNRTFDATTLQVYNEQLVTYGQPIHQKRKEFIDELKDVFQKYYNIISSGNETVSLEYESQLDKDNFSQLLDLSLDKDKVLQYTSVGIHKDDYPFLLQGHPLKKFGSQGQRKSFMISLKLAQFEFLKKEVDKKPILLFDDIFDKLDENRVKTIVEMVNNDTFGQVFITDTHQDRTELIAKNTNQSYQIINLK